MGSKQKPAATELEPVFALSLYPRPAMSRAIEMQQIREALQLAIQEIGGSNGRKLSGELRGSHDLNLEIRPRWGSWSYNPSAPE
jgi:hypothetical protein